MAEERPYSRGDFNRALILNALLDPFAIVLLAVVAVAGILLGALGILLPVGLVLYGAAAARTYFDEDVANRVLERERGKRREALESGEKRVDPATLAPPIGGLLRGALQREARNALRAGTRRPRAEPGPDPQQPDLPHARLVAPISRTTAPPWWRTRRPPPSDARAGSSASAPPPGGPLRPVRQLTPSITPNAAAGAPGASRRSQQTAAGLSAPRARGPPAGLPRPDTGHTQRPPGDRTFRRIDGIRSTAARPSARPSNRDSVTGRTRPHHVEHQANLTRRPRPCLCRVSLASSGIPGRLPCRTLPVPARAVLRGPVGSGGGGGGGRGGGGSAGHRSTAGERRTGR